MSRLIGVAVVWPGESGSLAQRGWGYQVIREGAANDDPVWGFAGAEEARAAGAVRVAELRASEAAQERAQDEEIARAEDAVAYDGGTPLGGV